MSEKLRQALSWKQVLWLGASVWIVYYSAKLVVPILLSDATLAEKIAVVVSFACFFIVYYSAGCLDSLAVFLGLLGVGFYRCGDALVRGRAWINELVRRFGAVFSDHIGTSELSPEGDGTRNWPKVWIVASLAMLVCATIGVHFATRGEGGPVRVREQPIASLGLAREEFKQRFELCLACGDGEALPGIPTEFRYWTITPAITEPPALRYQTIMPKGTVPLALRYWTTVPTRSEQ